MTLTSCDTQDNNNYMNGITASSDCWTYAPIRTRGHDKAYKLVYATLHRYTLFLEYIKSNLLHQMGM